MKKTTPIPPRLKGTPYRGTVPPLKNDKAPPEKTDAAVAGDFGHVTNEELISAIFHKLPDGASPAVCSKPGDPTVGAWSAKRADGTPLPVTNNNYVACSSYFIGEDGSFNVRKENFAALHFLMLDDLGTKTSMERLGDFELSVLIETSPGNHQGIIILAEPSTDIEEAESLQKALIAAGLSDKGATGLGRWARQPQAINGKEKYKDEEGKPFSCRVVEWRPNKRRSVQEIVDELNLELEPKKEAAVQHVTQDAIIPQVGENKVITALKARGLYKKSLGSGKHDITCPWADEHTDALDDGAAYFEPSEEYPNGGFRCHHSHGEKYHIRELLDYLDISTVEDVNNPVIKVEPGEIDRVVDESEQALAHNGEHYQSGGLIVSVATDPGSGDPSILPTSVPALTRVLSRIADFVKPQTSVGWTRCDPPARHMSILHDDKNYKYLPPLTGLARQPYFKESDDELVMEPGYDKISKIFGVFDPSLYPIPADPTEEDARTSLALLEDLLTEFRFLSLTDKAAALSAIFTAVVRPTLSHAPAFHVRAPNYGSGKSYLCELIGTFAGPGGNAKVSYPKTSDEATKVMLSLLLGNPAVIEFDDMDTDWLPHGSILRMLTAEHITDRILGHSKTATVSTRTLILGSGNNVGPVRDMLRRVLTIQIDPRCATPSTISYTGSPVEKVRKQRGLYVAAVLTIILAWRKYGSPRTDAGTIVTYGDAWSDYCRQPLMWLDQLDPATALLDQVTHDPDADALGILLFEWKRLFGSVPTPVRKVIETAGRDDGLMDAIREFPVMDKGFINNSKFGWFLKRNANRIVNGLKFERVDAPQRTAWRVVTVTTGDDE